MGYLASDVASVEGKERRFDRYVFLLDPGWPDDRRREILENFDNFSAAIGKRALAVRGLYPEHFSAEVLETYGLMGEVREGVLSLALLISDVAPSEAIAKRNSQIKPRSVVLHLAELYKGPGSIADLLREVARVVKETDALTVLDSMDRSHIENRWGWVTRYVELKPSFFGFGVNVNNVIDDVLLQISRRTSQNG